MPQELTLEEKVELYNNLVATHPNAVRKGATIPYTSVNGHMYSMVFKDGTVSIRLPEGERAAFIRKYKSENPVQYGAVLKEYVVVPDGLLKKTETLKPYFDMSYEYTSSLKPKPTKKK